MIDRTEEGAAGTHAVLAVAFKQEVRREGACAIRRGTQAVGAHEEGAAEKHVVNVLPTPAELVGSLRNVLPLPPATNVV